MAVSRQKKKELVDQYLNWIEESRALVLTHYIGLSVSQLDELRRNLREVGGEFHIVKNTLTQLAFERAGLEFDDSQFLEDTAIGFAFEDAPGMAKAIVDFGEDTDFIKLKVGYLSGERVGPEEIIALAKVPPLPELRAQLLRTLIAPATKLSRILAEPGRQLAAVLKAYSEKEAA